MVFLFGLRAHHDIAWGEGHVEEGEKGRRLGE